MNTPFFRFGVGILLFSAVIFMLNQISFIFSPIILLAKTVAVPFIIAGVLYYLFLPVFNFAIKKGIGKNVAIFAIFGSFLIVILNTALFLGPVVTQQFKKFIENIPSFAKKIEAFIGNVLNSEIMKDLNLQERIDFKKIISAAVENVDGILIYFGNNLFGILSTLTGAALLLVVVPFVLFYLLKDGDKVAGLTLRMFPKKHSVDVLKILKESNFALKSYIQGQVLVSFIVGCLIFIGYLIIDLDYALLLALIAMLTNLIPFVGPFIGLTFALVVGLMQSFKVGLLVILVVVVVQQFESNFVSPQIMGKRLDIHPLTIILLLLFAGKFAGLVGLLIAVPTYAVSKVISTNGYRLWRLRVEKKKKEHPFAE